MTMTPADQAYVEEFAAESRDLMRRALAYSAQKRAEERAKIVGVQLEDGFFNGRSASKSAPKSIKAPSDPKKLPHNQKAYILNGETKPLKEWCAQYSINPCTVLARIKGGKSLEDALKEPLKRRGMRAGRGRKPELHTLNGETKSIKQWAAHLGMSYQTLSNRLWRGVPLEEALTLGRCQTSKAANANREAAKLEAKQRRTTGGGSELSPVS